MKAQGDIYPLFNTSLVVDIISLIVENQDVVKNAIEVGLHDFFNHVEQSSYISHEQMYCQYDGQTYYPKECHYCTNGGSVLRWTSEGSRECSKKQRKVYSVAGRNYIT